MLQGFRGERVNVDFIKWLIFFLFICMFLILILILILSLKLWAKHWLITVYAVVL